jgi:AP-2 complex subunit mu-1
VPPTTATVAIKAGFGNAKYVPEKNALVWRVDRFRGGTAATLHAELELVESTKGKEWVPPPICAEFEVRQLTPLHSESKPLQ